MTGHSRSGDSEDLSLGQSAQQLLEECRMVLPGIQALFGFQLVAVFNSAFDQKLGATEQRMHLLAIALSALSVALVMTPAAYHRQMHIRRVTEQFIRLSTRLLLWSMLPLAVSLCIDFYLIAQVILNVIVAAWLATALFAVLITFWFVLPRTRSLQRLIGGR
jgi:hypothetical protein